MRLTLWQSAAALSLIVLARPAAAARRPRYGGTLRVEMRAALHALDPSENGEASFRLAPLVFDRLVRIDPQGRPQPAFAISWTHDPDCRRWQFRLRPGVQFHDGSPLSAAPALAAALQSALNGRTVSASNGSLIVECPRPAPDLPLELGLRGYVFARAADGTAVGTGPFRLARLDPGRHASFTANEDYWDGRPFPDAVEVEMGRATRDQWIDLEVGRADLVELGPGEVRRARASDRGVWSSAPVSLLALVFRDGHPADPRLRQVLALSIDRAAIQNVLFQRRADIAAGLLPQWLSGYEFLFSAPTDLAAARRLAAEVAPAARSLSLAHDGDPLSRSIAERIALNARDAGIAVHVTPAAPNADARLAAFRITSLEPAHALAKLALALGFPQWTPPDAPETLYASERSLLDGHRIVPLFHVPEDFGVGPRVRLWTAPAVTRLGAWRLAGVWLDGGRP
jgi:peptide/nickel transport system substrate-binding protein